MTKLYENKKEVSSYVKENQADYAKTYSIHEAKTNLSKLVKRAAAGETIYIGSYGKPEAVLTVVDERQKNAELRKAAFGCMKGKIPKALLDPLSDEIIDSFYSTQGLEDFIKK